MKINALAKFFDSPGSAKLPVLFLGHGSPMNAIEENEFVKGFRMMGKEIPRPQAILCISAHWETRGTFITAMETPRTIHDFVGFPRALYEVSYPAPGSPELARETRKMVTRTEVGLDISWGLDHGAWSVIRHLYPEADVPVIQMSLDDSLAPESHYELAKELSLLRQKGVLVVGSGNIVHNLKRVAWDKLSGEPFAFEWAVEANEKIKSKIRLGDIRSLIDYHKLGSAFDLAIPTPEHYLPLLYVLALTGDSDELVIFNDQPVGGSISMTSFRFG